MELWINRVRINCSRPVYHILDVEPSTSTEWGVQDFLDWGGRRQPLSLGQSLIPGADPGFRIGGSANPPGVPTYDFAKFCEKLHEIEKIWAVGRRPPPKSATEYYTFLLISVGGHEGISVCWYKRRKVHLNLILAIEGFLMIFTAFCCKHWTSLVFQLE